MSELRCSRKHTKYQPTDEEFRCPKCGAGPDDKDQFCLEPAEFDSSNEDVDCPLLHVDDMCNCYNCEYGVSGKSFAANIAKKHNLVPCPHCKGTGLVKKEGK